MSQFDEDIKEINSLDVSNAVRLEMARLKYPQAEKSYHDLTNGAHHLYATGTDGKIHYALTDTYRFGYIEDWSDGVQTWYGSNLRINS